MPCKVNAVSIDPSRPSGRIHALRKSRGYSLARLGELAGLSPSRISDIEHARQGGDPQPATIRKIAEALAVEPTEIDPEYFETVIVRHDGTAFGVDVRGGLADVVEGIAMTPAEVGKLAAKAIKAGHGVVVLPSNAPRSPFVAWLGMRPEWTGPELHPPAPEPREPGPPDLPASSRWTITGPGEPRNGRRTWAVRCACGNTSEVEERSLKSGGSKSCGCLAGNPGRSKAKGGAA